MNADWDEIKRLAADFQKAQLTTSLARLVNSTVGFSCRPLKLVLTSFGLRVTFQF